MGVGVKKGLSLSGSMDEGLGGGVNENDSTVDHEAINEVAEREQMYEKMWRSAPAPRDRGTNFIRRAQQPLYYGDYLQLDKLLDAQSPVSLKAGDPSHDELLFITVHQTYELWFKQIIHELDSVRHIFAELTIGAKKIGAALHRLLRIHEIQKILSDQIRVLETLTPQEFLDFRDYLFPASGFQSFQFRLIEIKLGVKRTDGQNMKYLQCLNEKHRKMIEAALAEPSLFELVERWLRNIPFPNFRGYQFTTAYEEAVNRMFDLDMKVIHTQLDGVEKENAIEELKKTKRTFESVYDRSVHDEMKKLGLRRMGFRATCSALLIMLYQDEPMLQLPGRLLRVLVDIDDQLNQWRYRHSQMVHRMIGAKMGTGGSLGFSYLKSTVDNCKVFSDIANMSTLLIPRRLLPNLPSEIRDQLKYYYNVEQFDRTFFEMGSGGDSIDWSFC
uniref:Tryptophan 2,3-dioxygenase n=1 Tax=Compsopogon caeruleus TaxID=31354 RepID=A0A7S1THA6_9RHOD